MYKAIRDSLDVRTIGIGHPTFREPAGNAPSPEGDAIHVWSAHFPDLDLHYKVLSALISRDEREKASSFRKPGDARRFVLRHGILRLVLGYYTHDEPALISLVNYINGKPGMDPRGEFFGLSFSLSHTREFFAIGITKKYNIGIDIVKMDRQYPFRNTAEFLFTAEEKALIAGTRPNQRYRQFFRIWALKEALLKATGGTVQMMNDTDVSAVINNSFVHDFCSITYQDAQYRYFIHECACGLGHHCAIAVNLGK